MGEGERNERRGALTHTAHSSFSLRMDQYRAWNRSTQVGRGASGYGPQTPSGRGTAACVFHPQDSYPPPLSYGELIPISVHTHNL